MRIEALAAGPFAWPARCEIINHQLLPIFRQPPLWEPVWSEYAAIDDLNSTRRLKLNSTRIFVMSIVCSMFAAGAAQAHQKHAAPAKVDYSKAEQMPFGIAADPKKAVSTMRIEMADTMRFTPAEVKVKRGETVRFVVTNKGRQMHEMVLGTMDDLKKHSELMKKHPGMEHDEPHMAHVAPGKTNEMGWRFSNAGTFYYGCLLPGHLEAGMIGKVIVE